MCIFMYLHEQDIGIWYTMMEVTVVVACFTNAAFLSEVTSFSVNYPLYVRHTIFFSVTTALLLVYWQSKLMIPQVHPVAKRLMQRNIYILDRIVRNIGDTVAVRFDGRDIGKVSNDLRIRYADDDPF
jgi:hypothetical protein